MDARTGARRTARRLCDHAPLVLVYLANLLVTKHGWGYWVVVAALIVGILSGLSSAWSMLRPKKPSKPPRTTVHFDDHS